MRFRAKIHPRNHYVYKVLSNFPAGMIFYHDFFLQKGNILLRNSIFLIVFSVFWKIHVFTKKASKKGIPFPGARARSEPFSSSRAHGKCIFRILLQKMEMNPFWLPNRKIIKIPHFWSKNDISAPMAPTLINVMVFLVFWDPFSSFSDLWGKFHPFSAKITFGAQK